MPPALGPALPLPGDERLKRTPALWEALDPARHGIDKNEQEAIFQRVRAELTFPQQEEFARLMDGRQWQTVTCSHPGFNHLYGQRDYMSMATVADHRQLTAEEYRTLATPWVVVTSRPCLHHDEIPALVSPRRAAEVQTAAQENGHWTSTEARPWGAVHVRARPDGSLAYQVSTKPLTPLRVFASQTVRLTGSRGTGVPYAFVWAVWMILSLMGWSLLPAGGSWWAGVFLMGSAVSIAAIAHGLHDDLHDVDENSPLGRLIGLERSGQDAGLLAQLVAAGWSWERLDSGALVECVELAGQERDAGLVADLVNAGWALDAEAAPELIEVAGRTLTAARRARVEEVSVEVPGLVRSCETPEDMHAACAALAVLYRDLEHLAEGEAAHHAQAEAPAIEARVADENSQHELAAEEARARAVASLESSRQAVRLTTRAHSAVMSEHSLAGEVHPTTVTD